MKKFVALVLATALIASLGAVFSFAEPSPDMIAVSRDQITTYNPEAEGNTNKGDDLALHGQNVAETELNDISEFQLEKIVAYGWFACKVKIQKFGYRINGGEAVLESEKFVNELKPDEAATIAGMAEANGFPEGESTRFDIVIPVYVGENIEVELVYLDEYDEVQPLDWVFYYTNTFGENEAPTAEPTATPEVTEAPEETEAPATEAPATEAPATETAAETATEAPKEEGGCGSVIGGSIAILAVMAASALVLRKKEH